MKSITPRGFFKMYFEQLPYSKTQKEAFKVVNKNVKVLTGNTYYKSFKVFKTAIKTMNVITPYGFFKMFYEQLPYSKTQKEAFNVLNSNVKILTGNTFYKSFNEFKTAIYG